MAADRDLSTALRIVREGWDELVKLMVMHDEACRLMRGEVLELRSAMADLRDEVTRLRDHVEGSGRGSA